LLSHINSITTKRNWLVGAVSWYRQILKIGYFRCIYKKRMLLRAWQLTKEMRLYLGAREISNKPILYIYLYILYVDNLKIDRLRESITPQQIAPYNLALITILTKDNSILKTFCQSQT
jgi:hypothetical protein